MKRGDKSINSPLLISEKKGQLTIFIIVAIVIVGFAVLAYLFFPRILTTLGITSTEPNSFIQTCIEKTIKNNVDSVSIHGGSLTPENYILYKDDKIGYLCYTENFYVPCVVQQPLLKQHIENEISRGIKNDADSCFDEMKKSFEGLGYAVNMKRGDTVVELLPKKISVTFNNDLTLTKDSAKRYERINVVLNNNLYELTSVADSITNWEARYGNAETTLYMNYYHDMKVEKMLQGDGSKIYILTNRNSGNKFQFASRGIVMPPGISGGVI